MISQELEAEIVSRKADGTFRDWALKLASQPEKLLTSLAIINYENQVLNSICDDLMSTTHECVKAREVLSLLEQKVGSALPDNKHDEAKDG